MAFQHDTGVPSIWDYMQERKGIKILWYLWWPGPSGKDLREMSQSDRYLGASEPKSLSSPLRPLQHELKRQKHMQGRGLKAHPERETHCAGGHS